MMVESDHSEAKRDMDTLQLSSDSVDAPTNKRQRVIDSEDEQDLPVKKRRNSSDGKSEVLTKNGNEAIPDKNGTNENAKEGEYVALSENEKNLDEKSLSDPNRNEVKQEDMVVEQEDKIVKQDNLNESPSKDKHDSTVDDSPVKIKTEEESKDSPMKESITSTDADASISEDKEEDTQEDEIIKEADESVDEEEESKEDMMKKKCGTKNRSVDTEVVDGLELSVECESDREPSSENEDQKDIKPRPKTIIIKAKPNDSELECSSSQEEKSDSQEAIDTPENKPEKKKWKRRGPRTNFSKLRASGSDDSHNNNSDEDYSPRTKKKMKKSPVTKRSAKRSTESKRGRGRGARKSSRRRSIEDMSNGENTDVTSTDQTNAQTKDKEEAKEELSEKESLASNSVSVSNSEDEEKPLKGRRGRRSSAKPEDNKHIQALKKYLSVAGVKIRSYNEIWADCKTNTARVSRLKELLEKNGVKGRPTLEKCKRAREKREKMQEVSELDTSNIISEGRVTRARRNINSNKKASVPDESPRYREARNTLKRIQTVIDSDSE